MNAGARLPSAADFLAPTAAVVALSASPTIGISSRLPASVCCSSGRVTGPVTWSMHCVRVWIDHVTGPVTLPDEQHTDAGSRDEIPIVGEAERATTADQ